MEEKGSTNATVMSRKIGGLSTALRIHDDKTNARRWASSAQLTKSDFAANFHNSYILGVLNLTCPREKIPS